MDEAIEWVKRCPNPMDGDSEIEIRQVFETPTSATISPPNCASKSGASASR